MLEYILYVFFSIVRGISWLRSIQGRVKPKTVKLLFAASLLKTQY